MKLATQILILALTPLVIVFGHNFYQSFYLKKTLESHLDSTLASEASVSMEHLSRQRKLSRQIAQVLASSQTVIEALNSRDSVILHELGAQVINAGLVSSIVFIDPNGFIAARSNEMYHFNDSIKSSPLGELIMKRSSFEGIVYFDGQEQLGILIPIMRFQTNLVGYVLVSHILDGAFMKSLNGGSASAYLTPRQDWLPSSFTHHHYLDVKIPTLSGKEFYLHVWKDARVQQDFIKKFYTSQNMIIIIMMVLFFGLILWVSRGITQPLHNLGQRLEEFAYGELTLHGLSHALSKKHSGKSEIAVLIKGVLATLRTLALAHQSLESSKERALDSQAKARRMIEQTLGQLRVPLLSLRLHCDEKTQNPQAKEALHVMDTIIDSLQTKLHSLESFANQACIAEVLIERIVKLAKSSSVDLHVKGVDTLPEIINIDEERWCEFFEFMWRYFREFLATKPHVQMEWVYRENDLIIQINSNTHTKALQLFPQIADTQVSNLDGVASLHVKMLTQSGVKFETSKSGINIHIPSVKTATIKAKKNQSPL